MSSSFLANRILISSSSPYHHRQCLPISTQSHQPKELPFIAHYLISSFVFSPIRALKCSASTNLTATTQPQQPKELPFIAQYLISSFGFSPDRALEYSADKRLTAIKSSEQPESVVKFLKDVGLSDDQTEAVVSSYPLLLASNVDKTLKPNVLALMDGGFSGDLLVDLIRYNPVVLCLEDNLSRLLFWRDFVGNNDQALLKTTQRYIFQLTSEIDNHILPLIDLLKEYELSNQDIVSLLGVRSPYLKHGLDSLRQKLELIEEMGISQGAKMFVRALKLFGGYSKNEIKRKVEFFMVTYGWSEEEVHAAFRKFPDVLALSENKVKSNMDFLIKKAGLESRSIALQPQLLACSVERVLIPRYTVFSALQAKGLKKKCSLSVALCLSKSNFLQRYVAPYEKDVPGIGEAYAAAFGGKVPV